MEAIFLISLFLIGIGSQLIPFVPKDLYKKINRFIINVPLPAITLYQIPRLQISQKILYPTLSAWILFFGAILFFVIIGKYFKLEKATVACLILSCGLSNTSFIGFPVLTQLYGSESIQYAIFVDQPGSFLIMSTMGIMVASYASTGSFSLSIMLKKLFSFLPFLCFLIALFLPKSFFSDTINTILLKIGNLMIPLAMLSLGLQFKLKLKSIAWKGFSTGLAYKLLLGPFLIYFIYIIVLQQNTFINRISVIECAMPPMITSSIIAAEYGLDEDLAGELPTLGIILSIPTLIFWYWFLG